MNRSFNYFKSTALVAFMASVLIGLVPTQAIADNKITVTDSRGTHQIAAHPSRIVALNWDITEQLIELGVTPIAMPDKAGYEQWVVKPQLPTSIEDIGTRVEPNYEKIARLKPDMIIVASPQRDLIPQLERIAPVMFYQTYSASHSNAQAAIDNYRLLAQLVNKTDYAEQQLQRMENRLSELKAALNHAYNNQVPKVTTLRFASKTAAFVYGDNSISQFALSKLGIEPAMPLASTQWGVTQKRISDLHTIGSGTVLYFLPLEQEAQLKQSVMWQAMPFIRQHRVNSVAATWSYGGALSILYMAEALTESLIEIAPTS
ncbi:ABC transporter substrate-binding protein [Photobacterium swingsii]|nr:iron-siderophore ABC transporter substrate-binding protein [Photobacterium swingsii]